jgi:acyl transferase domain-containing protein
MDPIAIVGIALDFPGSTRVDEFWETICSGAVRISRFSDEALLRRDPRAAIALARDDYVPVEGLTGREWLFDEEFFNFSAREASDADPQLRCALQIAYHALEDAACDSARFDGVIGVFFSSGTGRYAPRVGAESEYFAPGLDGLIANEPDHIPTTISYKLGLRGPSLNIRTACSGSLVAVHYACQSLLNGESDIALAGGVHFRGSVVPGYFHSESGILSPTGECRPFERRANGTVPGNGCGAVALMRLDDARRSGRAIWGLVRSTAVNNDGSAKVGYTAPSVSGQIEVIRAAQRRAGVKPNVVGYVETHGTGTSIGDAIELAALRDVFGSADAHECAIGATKANIGHLGAAAGIASLIKTVLALHHRVIPPIAAFDGPAEVGPKNGFVFPREARSWWPTSPAPLAGVSSFGIGGTNAHVVLQASTDSLFVKSDGGPQIFLLSGRTTVATRALARDIGADLVKRSDEELGRAARILALGRRRLKVRTFAIGETARAIARSLGELDTERLHEQGDRSPRIALLLPGQGNAYPGLAAALSGRFQGFRNTIEQGCGQIQELMRIDARALALRQEALPDPSLSAAAVWQPVSFLVSYAIARYLQELGVEPVALIGHSLGEYVAATLAGVFSLEDALRVVCARARLHDRTAPGGMIAVSAEPDVVEALLGSRGCIAAVNGDRHVTIAARHEDLSGIRTELDRASLRWTELKVDRAFHSPTCDSVLDDLRGALKSVELRAPKLPIASTVTGDWMTMEEAVSIDYWVAQMRKPVQFGPALRRLTKKRVDLCVETGPGKSLTRLCELASGFQAKLVACWSEPGEQEQAAFLSALGSLWAVGVDVQWELVPMAGGPHVRLPHYPFEGVKRVRRTGGAAAAHPPMQPQCYVERWEKIELHDGEGLPNDPPPTVVVRAGDIGEDQRRWSTAVNAWVALFERLSSPSGPFRVVLDTGDISGDTGPTARVITAARALNSMRVETPELVVVTRGAYSVTAGETPVPSQAAVAAALRVIAQELDQVKVCHIDLPSTDVDRLADRVGQLPAATEAGWSVALRDGIYGNRVRAVNAPTQLANTIIRSGGRYLVVGGLSAQGLAIARWLAQERQARLILIEPSGIDLDARAIVAQLVDAGATVELVEQWTSAAALSRARYAELLSRVGRLDGLFYASRLYSAREGVPVERTEAGDLEAQFDLKPRMLEALAEGMPECDIGFVVICSSLSTLLGGVGHATYAAANSALAAVALDRGRRTLSRWITIDWDAWRVESIGQVSSQLATVALDPAVAMSLLENALASDQQRVAIATDLHARMHTWVASLKQDPNDLSPVSRTQDVAAGPPE